MWRGGACAGLWWFYGESGLGWACTTLRDIKLQLRSARSDSQLPESWRHKERADDGRARLFGYRYSDVVRVAWFAAPCVSSEARSTGVRMGGRRAEVISACAWPLVVGVRWLSCC